MAFRLPRWEKGRTALITTTEAYAEEIFDLWDWTADGLVEAHNVWFEYCIWTNICVKKLGWPAVPLSQWRCSAAKAATHALPRGLDDALTALKLYVKKDMEGHKVMLKMSKPRKSRKKEREEWAKAGVKSPRYLWHDSPELRTTLEAYCRQDVLAEEALSQALPDLNPKETQLFLLDLQINAKGFQLDKVAVKNALKLLAQEQRLLNRELTQLTKGKVRRATQRERIIKWVGTQGFLVTNTQKEYLDTILSLDWPGITPTIRRVLQIVRALGRSSTAKYQAMKNWMARDGRVRGALLYHGATTGRWTGKGVQPHNFPKGDKDFKDMDQLWTILKTQNRSEIRAVYPGVMEALSSGLRGAITASKGHQLFVADYASIEARVVMWLAGEEEALTLFASGADIYLDMASTIYNKVCNKVDHPTERGLGKIAILGLGYQMGANKFQATCAAFGITIDDEMAQHVVTSYREKYWRVKQMWREIEDAAIAAVCADSQPVSSHGVVWRHSGHFLYCRLPSGRDLAYPFPQLRNKPLPWGGEATGLTFMGFDAYSHQWQRQTTYGGALVENLVQAIARDILAEAIYRLGPPYKTVLSVHDEIIAEALEGEGNVTEFEQEVSRRPMWASDLPIAVDAWAGFRYKK